MNAFHFILFNFALLVSTLEAAPAVTKARIDGDGIFDFAKAEVTTMDGKSAVVKIVVGPEERSDKLKTIMAQNYQVVYMPKGAEVITNIKPEIKTGIELWNGGIPSQEAVKMLRAIDYNTKHVKDDITGLFLTPQIYKIDDIAAGMFTSDVNKHSQPLNKPFANAWFIGSKPTRENSIKSNPLVNNLVNNQGVFPLTKLPLHEFQLINTNLNPFVTFY